MRFGSVHTFQLVESELAHLPRLSPHWTAVMSGEMSVSLLITTILIMHLEFIKFYVVTHLLERLKLGSTQ